MDGLCCGRSGGEGPVGGHPRPRAHPGHGPHLQRYIQTETKTQEITSLAYYETRTQTEQVS